MTAILTRPVNNRGPADDCRYPNWCEGCSKSIHGEKNHWSSGIRFWDYDIADERLAVELFGYENDTDGIDPVRVYIAAGNSHVDEDGVSLATGQARALGEALVGFEPEKNRRSADDMVHTAFLDDGGWAVTAEYRRERGRRDGSDQEAHVEFSLWPEQGRAHSIRVRLDMDTARTFGQCLIEQADLADAANRFFGLVTE